MTARRFVTLALAAIMAVVTATFTVSVVNAPAAEAVPPIGNPSAEYRIGCTGAWATIQVNWTGANQVTVRWSLEDTTSAYGRQPVLRIAAQGPDGTTPHVFRNGHAYFILEGGNGSATNGTTGPWNPGNLGQFNHLRVKVQNGTTEQGVDCSVSKNIFNYSRVAYQRALFKEGTPYQYGGEGNPGYDCSGLVKVSYGEVRNFPGWPVRTADAMYNWASANSDPGRFYAVRVPFADLKVGDLIFYNTIPGNARYIDHVAFYAGNGQVFDAQQDGVPVGYHNDYTGSRVAAYRVLGITTV
jgi:cell wall-associated NlpC family hydrolase